MKKIMLIFILLFQASFLLSMQDDEFFSDERLFDEKFFFHEMWYGDDFANQEDPIDEYSDEEKALEKTIITVPGREEGSQASNHIKDAEEQPQKNKIDKPSRSSRPKKQCNFPECSLVVTNGRFKDHLMRAHSICPWCNFEGNNRKELIEHLHEVTSVKDINHDEAAYFCLSCKKFVTTYLSDFKKHGCYDK